MSIFTILFVCTGNTCRSQMAEGIANKWLEDHQQKGWLAVSAGVSALHGDPTSKGTIEALSQRQIQFKGISKPLTEDVAKKAKIVLCMSHNHLITVKKFTTCAELLDPAGDIVDPFGQDQSVYDALAQQMELLIAAKLQALTSKEA